MTDSAAGEELEKTTSSVLCSICLDAVSDDVDRSRAKLQCGHQFHLDCIGSAFNVKGVMQCPNCRKVESGLWLYASGPTRSFPEMGDWALHEDLHVPSYHNNRFIPWCPDHSIFEALGSSQPAYHNLPRHHQMFVEHRAASSMTHSYVPNFRPIPPASSNTSESIENPNIGYLWNGASFSHVFPVTADMHYHNGFPHIPPANSAHPNSTDHAPIPPVTLRPTRGDFSVITSSGSYIHPLPYGHGRAHERLQLSHTIHHPHQPTNPLAMPAAINPSMARLRGRRVLPLPPVPANPVSDRNVGFFILSPRGSLAHSPYDTPANSVSDRSGGIFSVAPRNSVVQSSNEPENLLQSSFHSGAGSDSNRRTGSFRNGHWS